MTENEIIEAIDTTKQVYKNICASHFGECSECPLSNNICGDVAERLATKNWQEFYDMREKVMASPDDIAVLQDARRFLRGFYPKGAESVADDVLAQWTNENNLASR